MRSDSEQTLRVAKVKNKARKHTRDSDSGTGFSPQVREHRQMPKKNRHNGGDSSKLCKTSITDQTQVQTQTYILQHTGQTLHLHCHKTSKVPEQRRNLVDKWRARKKLTNSQAHGPRPLMPAFALRMQRPVSSRSAWSI